MQISQLKIINSIFEFYQFKNQMGASTQKSIKNIIQSKYSFVHPKSQYPIQISCWKFTEEELQQKIQCEGQAMRWPFKLYSDQGYIFVCIQNNNTKTQRFAKNSQEQPWKQLGSMNVSVGLIEFLYSFTNNQVEEYSSNKIQLQNQSKYIKDSLTLTIYVYAGQNLSSLAKLKLVTNATSLQRYICRGGICSISKLYHEYEEIIDLGKQIKGKDQQKSKLNQFYIELSTLIQDKIKVIEDQKIKKQQEAKQLINILEKFKNHHLLRKLLIDPYIKQPFQGFTSQKQGSQSKYYPFIDCSNWASNKNLILKIENKPIEQPKKPQQKDIVQKKQVKNNLNQSLPFACQITQINFKQKKKVGQMQFLNESMSIVELSALGQRHLNFIKIVCEEQDYLILTDYASIKQYSKCVEFNVRLAINNSASLCYNYYINDLEYISNYITPLPLKPPAQAIAFQYNIEHFIQNITEAIIRQTSTNKKGDSLNNRVAIYSASSPFSDQNCSIVIGYLICRYLYTYQKAFSLLNKAFKDYKKQKQAKLQIHKLYVDQLLTLQGRILITSLSNYGVSLNTSLWRVYQVSNNHCHPSHLLINRYIGQISNLNQIQSLPNHAHHFYLVISHQVTNILSVLVQKWEKDTTIKIPQGITGIKILVGKQFEHRQQFIAKAKEMIAPILKYEFLNRNRNNLSFNNQFLLKFINEVTQSNVQIQNIQKSFRKPQPFTPLYLGFQQQNPGKQIDKFSQPYNSKQKLTFKYPYLRPTWQPIKDDQYYFVVQIRPQGATIQIVKGKHWIGLEVDKQTFFQNIVKLYMQNIDQSKIWITQQGQQSLFGQQIDL